MAFHLNSAERAASSARRAVLVVGQLSETILCFYIHGPFIGKTEALAERIYRILENVKTRVPQANSHPHPRVSDVIEKKVFRADLCTCSNTF